MTHSPTAPGTTASRTVAEPALPKGNIPSALVGTYTYRQDGTWHTTLRADGTYAQWNPTGNLDITGRYGVSGHLAVFEDDHQGSYEGSACAGPGTYKWSFNGAVLVMVVKQDDCSVGRQGQWTARWRKVSASPLWVASTLAAAQHHQ